MLTFVILATSVERMPAKINLTAEQLAQRRAIGARIRTLREEQGWTQPQLAERAGLGDRQTVYRVELGTHASSIDAYLVIAAALGVPLRELIPLVAGAPTARRPARAPPDPGTRAQRGLLGGRRRTGDGHPGWPVMYSNWSPTLEWYCPTAQSPQP